MGSHLIHFKKQSNIYEHKTTFQDMMKKILCHSSHAHIFWTNATMRLRILFTQRIQYPCNHTHFHIPYTWKSWKESKVVKWKKMAPNLYTYVMRHSRPSIDKLPAPGKEHPIRRNFSNSFNLTVKEAHGQEWFVLSNSVYHFAGIHSFGGMKGQGLGIGVSK